MIFNPPQGQWVDGRFVLLPQPSNPRGFSTGNPQADSALGTVGQGTGGQSQPGSVNGGYGRDAGKDSDVTGPQGNLGPINGGTLGAIGGTLLGASIGTPLGGLIGRGIGTSIDMSRANDALDRNAGVTGLNGGRLGLSDYLSGMLHGGTFGLFGTSINDAARNSAARGALNASDEQIANEVARGGGIPGGNYSGPSTPGWDYGGTKSSDYGSDYGPSNGVDYSGGGFAPDAGFYRTGGHVNASVMPGNPPGPDDRYIAAQTGEYVVNRKASEKHKGLLEAINRGASKKELKGLLG